MTSQNHTNMVFGSCMCIICCAFMLLSISFRRALLSYTDYKICLWESSPRKQNMIYKSTHCSRLKFSMSFKRDSHLQNIPLSKQPFKMQPQSENEGVTWSHHYNLPVARTNKCRAFVTTRSGVRWLILDSSHYTGNMYHIIYAQV